VREIERRIQRKLSRLEQRRLHDEVSGQNFDFHEIVAVGLSLFSN